MAKITTIFWDIGGVLFSEAEISGPEFQTLRDLLQITPEKADKIFNSVWYKKMRLGKLGENEYWQLYIKKSGQNLDIEQIKDLYRISIKPNEQLLKLVKKLSKKYDQYIVSNHSNEWMAFLVSNFELSKYFKAIFSSSYLKLAKPDPKYFEKILEITGRDPKEIVYIDDNKDNIKTAKGLGINSIRFSDNNQTILKLQDYV